MDKLESLYVSIVVCIWLAVDARAWFTHRRSRKADTTRIEELNTENAELRAVVDRMTDLARMLEGANYQLGCMIYGQEAVDRMIGQLKKNARN